MNIFLFLRTECRRGDPMWDPATKLIKFVPETPFSDPSYHLPHFYELFALQSDEQDRAFWKNAAARSRAYLQKACHPEIGISPEYKGMAVVQQKISHIILCILLHNTPSIVTALTLSAQLLIGFNLFYYYFVFFYYYLIFNNFLFTKYFVKFFTHRVIFLRI